MTRPPPCQGGTNKTSSGLEELLFHQYPCAPMDNVSLASSPSSQPLLPYVTHPVNNMDFSMSSSTTSSTNNIMDEEHFFFSPPPPPSSSLLQSLSRQSSSSRESFNNQERKRTRRNTVVHFSKILQIREVQHRKDMSPLELQERWDISARVLPAISRSIFDDHVLVWNPQDSTDCLSSFPSSTNSSSSSSSSWEDEVDHHPRHALMKRRRRRDAYLIRRKVLSDMADCSRRGYGEGSEGNDDDHHDDFLASLVARNYSQNSEQNVREAHIAALKHAHEVAGLDDDDGEEKQGDHYCSSLLSTPARKDNHDNQHADDDDACHDSSTTKEVPLASSSSSLPQSGRGIHHQHTMGKRVGAPGGNHPLAAVKRLRNST